MPLQRSSSDSAFRTNVKTLMGEIGKSPHVQSREQALAIAYSLKRRGKADGGGLGFGLLKPPGRGSILRNEARAMMHAGPIMSAVPGRTDRHNMKLASGAYVMPAQAVSHLGQNNTMAGFKVLNSMFGPGSALHTQAQRIAHGPGAPPTAPTPRGSFARGGGDNGGARGEQAGAPVDVVTAGGEYVIPPSIVAAVGGGDISHGHNVLDAWVNGIKQEHIRTLKKLPGPAKS